jgi:type IV secretory pathway protease TraF
MAARPESDWFRGDGGELIEVRYLHIPGVASDEIDEIVCGPMHLETMDADRGYINVAGLMVRIHAIKGRLSITCEPDDCTRINVQGGA